ncbi:hypothetical protein IAU60_005175 [Kwoniella sp. DSM 27419]
MAGSVHCPGDTEDISPKTSTDMFIPRSYSSAYSHRHAQAHTLDHTDSSSSRHSSFSSQSSHTSTSNVSFDKETHSLPKYTTHATPHLAADVGGPTTFASGSKKLLQTLRPRRRSSLPFIHLARRKSSQIALTLGIVVLSILLLREVQTNKRRQELWAKKWELTEWDSRHTLHQETNLVNLRRRYEMERRMELMSDRTEGVMLNRKKPAATQLVWGPADEQALREEVSDRWPIWWGNPDLVGPSPFDHGPGPLPPDVEPRRFLFLTDYNDYLERMNTHTYEIVDAALRHPHISVDVWGPGWAGYDRSIPLSANVRKRAHRLAQLETSKAEFEHRQELERMEKEEELKVRRKKEWLSRRFEISRPPVEGGDLLEDGLEEELWDRPPWDEAVPEECSSDVQFDIVFTISNIFNENDPHVDALDCGALLIQQLGDCHELRCSYEWYPHANNITVSKYAFELLELFHYDKVKERYPDWQMGMFGHSPDTANEWDFYPVAWSNKTADAKVFGYDGSFYPIRTTVTDALRYHEENPDITDDSIVSRHPHPGYTVSVASSARQQPLETYELAHEYYETHLKLREDFAKGMRESRICVFDASLERKMIRKYAQALLSGCVIAADLPTEHEDALSKFVIPLKSTWGIDKINEALRYHLDRPELLQQMAVDGLVYARQHFTTSNKVSHLLQMADHYREGARGYEFPYGFSMRCRSYWSGDAYRPPWCYGEGHRGLEE